MNILMVSSYLPYPLFSGGHIRLYNLLKELSKNHTITLVCEKRGYQTEKDVQEVSLFCVKVETIPRKTQWTIENIIKTGFSSYPFLMVGHELPMMKKRIEELLHNNTFDLVHVETFYVMQNLPQIKIPLVLAEQNIEYFVYKRYAQQAPFLLKYMFYLDVGKMRQWEETYWKSADWVVVTSENEKKEVRKHNQHVTIVPNGVDLQRFGVRSSEFGVRKREKVILFIGDFRWVENKDAVEWLLTTIWPKLKPKAASEGFKITLWIVGKKIPDTVKVLTDDPDVRFDEHASDDTRQIYEKADLLLAPIRVGGGGKFKILESMASGIPVVTTTIGIEGTNAKDSESVFIADRVDELVGKTIKILENETLGRKLAINARILIEQKYDWKKIVSSLEDVYRAVVDHH